MSRPEHVHHRTPVRTCSRQINITRSTRWGDLDIGTRNMLLRGCMRIMRVGGRAAARIYRYRRRY